MFSHSTIPILMYHSISCSTNPKFRDFTVPPTRFSRQMAYLHDAGYTPMTVTQLVEREGKSLPEKPVVLTFDDGMADFYTDALPCLTRFGFPATLYIATSYVEGSSGWLGREGEATRPMLTWEQILHIQDAGIECAAHSHTHPQLDMLTPSAVYDELFVCKKLLEGHLNRQVTSFAYPYGYYTEIIQKLVRAMGYISACAVKHDRYAQGSDIFALPRLMVGETTSDRQFADLLSGNTNYGTQLFTLYARARTHAWRVVRKSLAHASTR